MSRSGNLIIDEDPVRTALCGLVQATDHLTLFKEERVVLRSDWKKDKVAIISGGGSGHEPFAAGLVGKGGITGAVCGSIFASPSTGSVLAAIREVTGPLGCLLVVFNYTGDRINFSLAANRAKAEGLKVSVKFIQDDCALESEDKAVGRRGLLGGIPVLKILSAAAEEGKNLDEIDHVFDDVTAPDNLGTIGFSASGCSLPVGTSGISLGRGELELGLGIHGEPGIRKGTFVNIHDLIFELFNFIQKRLNLCESDNILLLVNNLGGLAEIEVLNILKSIQDQIQILGAKIIRCGNGHIMTSLDMAGLNFTILKLSDETVKWIDAPTKMLGWPKITPPGGSIVNKSSLSNLPLQLESHDVKCNLESLKKLIEKVSIKLIDNEVKLNDLDALTGDGDCGSTAKLGAMAIMKIMASSSATSYSSLVFEIGASLEKDMGGSSGSLLSILFTAIAAELRLQKEDSSLETISCAFGCGIDEVMHVGRAQRGDRTMLDALIPAKEALESNKDKDLNTAIAAAARAARTGAASTSTMVAKAGRAAYCKDRNSSQSPDAGAVMISTIFEAML